MLFKPASIICLALLANLATAQTVEPTGVLIDNVRIFDGTTSRLSGPSYVLVVGNVIRTVSSTSIALPSGISLTRIQGGGKTLMPGLIDAHTHLMFGSVPQVQLLTRDIGYTTIAAAKGATEMLLRGYTSVRDMGGPVFGLKQAIDAGLIPGPRIWPSGAFISQSGGHGDFRLPNDLPARPGDFTFAERMGATAIADSPDIVRMRAREQLALGASQIKVMAGGGAASSYDPLDVTQYTTEEIRAAVEAAENWGTYVAVHAYTPRAIKQAIDAGVKCIDHGQLMDEASAKLMAEKGVWFSVQAFVDDKKSAYAEGSPSRLKQLEMFAGTETAIALAKKYKLKIAWGTDYLFSPALSALQGNDLAKMARWFTPAEVLKMATSDNADLLALSGKRSPYAGKLGVVAEGALADLLLVDGDPIANIKLVEDPAKNMLVIIKDGKIYKNIVR